MKVALNFQTDDLAMSLNEALFSDNGRSGYILKPEILRNLSLDYNPTDYTFAHQNRPYQKLELKIISGQQIPSPSDYEANPIVKVNIYGVAVDRCEWKTNVYPNNGLFNPKWDDETTQFKIHFPELAFIKFTVEDNVKGETFGEYTDRLVNMRKGNNYCSLYSNTLLLSI